MKPSLLAITLFLCAFSANAGKRHISVLGWNVQSGENNPDLIAKKLEDFDGYDLIGLSEVNKSNTSKYLEASKVGEGAYNKVGKFESIVGDTGAGDRMMIIYDTRRFELVDTVELDALAFSNYRAPLYGRFKLKNEPRTEFIFMVNHLARTNDPVRMKQSKGLVQWVKNQNLPVIAVGDYNFDYSIDDCEGNDSFVAFLDGSPWKWAKPEKFVTTNTHPKYHGILDFIFYANMGINWKHSCVILNNVFQGFQGDPENSDHYPIHGEFWINF